MDRMNDDVFIRLANETWHISVDHHGILFFYPFVSIATRKSCGSRFRSSGTACVTPTPPDRWSGWAAAGSPCRTRRSRPERCSTKTDSWSGKSTPTVTAREVRHNPSYLYLEVQDLFKLAATTTFEFIFIFVPWQNLTGPTWDYKTPSQDCNTTSTGFTYSSKYR